MQRSQNWYDPAGEVTTEVARKYSGISVCAIRRHHAKQNAVIRTMELVQRKKDFKKNSSREGQPVYVFSQESCNN